MRVAGMDRRSGYVFCEPEGWQRREKIIVGRGEEKRAKIKRQQFRHSELLSDSPCSNHAAPRSSAPKTKKTILERRRRVILLPEDFDYHTSPAACHHSISRSSPLEPLCVLLVLDRARAQPVKASVIYRAASRCESWGNDPAHA